MTNLISGKEALIALANGEDVEFHESTYKKEVWFSLNKTLISISEILEEKIQGKPYTLTFRLKQKTITLNSIEVPAPFEPKEGDTVFIPVNFLQQGYMECKYPTFEGHCYQFGAWRTEDEIKQVVVALRQVFGIRHTLTEDKFI